MIHQFALEYASKSPLYTTKNGYTTALLRPGPSDPDAPLDLTVSKYQENHGKEPQPGTQLNPDTLCGLTSLWIFADENVFNVLNYFW